jgi:hypothetical protein
MDEQHPAITGHRLRYRGAADILGTALVRHDGDHAVRRLTSSTRTRDFRPLDVEAHRDSVRA